MKKILRKKQGITLIALVVTIVVLLILAGVSISMLTGENGILNQAKKAVNETNKAAADEETRLDEYSKYIDNALGNLPKVSDTTPGVLDGEGTTEKPYKIESVEDLVAFLNSIREGSKYENQTIELSTTLDLSVDNSYVDKNSTSFGDYNGDGEKKGLYEELNDKDHTGLKLGLDIFKGTFDGKGNEIKNIYSKIDTARYEIGFFSYNQGGTIKNLTLGGEYYISEIGEDYSIIGTFAGYNDYGEILNCTNNVRITINNVDKEFETDNMIGGIAGANNGTVKNCINKADMSINIKNSIQNIEKSLLYLGGIVGKNDEESLVDNCQNDGKINVDISVKLVTAGNYKTVTVGGIAGVNEGRIINSINHKDINIADKRLGESNTRTSIKLGGIVGTNDGEEVTNVINYGNIIGRTDDKIKIGGIVGKNNDVNKILQNSYNKGTITGSAMESELRIGGIIGDGEGTIARTYNVGKVVAESETKYVGGIIGDLHSDTKVSNSKYLASTAEAAADSQEVEGIERVNSLTAEEIKGFLNDGVKEFNTKNDLIQWTNVN